jgi:hypothetical protein
LNAFFLLLAGTVQAGVPIVYDQEAPSDAVSRVVQATGLPPDQLDPTPLDNLLEATPRVLGNAAIRHCSGAPAHTSDLRALLVRAEAALRSGDTSAAMDQADLGMADLGCLADRVEISMAARLFLLRFDLLLRQGQTDAARGELRTALSLQPDAAANLVLPAGSPPIEDLRTEVPLVALTIAPRDSTCPPSIDGHDPPKDGGPMRLSPGLHLLQIPSTAGLRSAWLTVQGDATLVVPGAFHRPLLERLASVTDRDDVEALILATLGSDGVYATQGGCVWLVSQQDGVPHATTLAEPPPAPSPEKGHHKDKKKDK